VHGGVPNGVNAMSLELKPLSDVMGVEAIGVDLSKPIPDDTFAEIQDAYLKHIMVLFRDQSLTLPQMMDFTALFGEVPDHANPKFAHPDHPEVLILSNLKKDGKAFGAAPEDDGGWHSDNAYLKAPCSASVFYAEIVPDEKGDTLFADMYAVYDALSPEMKQRIDGLKWRTHSDKIEGKEVIWPPKTPDGKAMYPDVFHPVVRTHPETGRKALFLCMRHIEMTTIVDMDVGEGQALLHELREFSTQPKFVHTQHWDAGDVMVWDNRCSLHSATYWDQNKYERLIYRTFAKGDVPY
jgi:taurine dioxygenase